MSKHCVLFVIDALAYDVIRERVDRGEFPNVAMLLRRGNLSPCTSIFPSITPAATCSIATGEYPRRHGIEGACWMDIRNDDIAYFGDDWKLMLKEGLTKYLVDFGDRLNYERLSQPLIYEHLDIQGIESAAINFMWFRGPHPHKRRTPIELRLLATELPDAARGPRYLKLGDFVEDLPASFDSDCIPRAGLLGRYGFEDETTAACLLEMARSRCLPRFTVGYFPLNDDDAHAKGLARAAEARLVAFDEFLGEFIDAIGGWDRVGQEYSFVIVGDHSQSEPLQDKDVLEQISLPDVLSNFSQAGTAAGFDSEDQILICPNMRAAAIYFASDSVLSRQALRETLLREVGVDLVIEQLVSPDGNSQFSVTSGSRGNLTFSRATSEHEEHVADRYGNRWCVSGQPAAVDVSIGQDGSVVEGAYPNALERIEGAFTSGPSPMWITAMPGHEFATGDTSAHPKGSHGSLHRDDSIAALITTSDVDLSSLPSPEHPRIVDVMDLCLATCGATRQNPATEIAGPP